MRKQETVSALSSRNSNSNSTTKKNTILNQFAVWFRDFLDNAE
jgi:hypothetical protein